MTDYASSLFGNREKISQLNLHQADENKVVYKSKNIQFQWPDQRKRELVKQIQEGIILRNRVSQRREDHSGVKSLTVHKKERRKLAQSSYWVYTCDKSAHPEDRTEAPMTIQTKQVYHENLAEIRPVKRVTPRGRGRLCNVQTTPLYVSNSVFVSSEIGVRSFITLSQGHSLG